MSFKKQKEKKVKLWVSCTLNLPQRKTEIVRSALGRKADARTIRRGSAAVTAIYMSFVTELA